MMWIKSGDRGAKVNGIQPEMILAFLIAASVYDNYGVKCVITDKQSFGIPVKFSKGERDMFYMGSLQEYHIKHISLVFKIKKTFTIHW